MPTNSHTEPCTDHGWDWLDTTDPIPLTRRHEENPDNALDTAVAEPHIPVSPPEPETVAGSGHGMPVRARIALAASLIGSAILIGGGVLTLHGGTTTPELPIMTAAAPPTLTSATPSTAFARSEACRGLTGDLVTDNDGDAATVTGVIAAFEHAYYTTRDAAAALRLTGPEAGLDPHMLAAGIASIPAGTRHCVAITPIADTAADVHLVEIHPSGQRRDYLQVINVRRDENRMLITNIQKRA
ncbi:hypothetical protein [Nocardia sputi]|uniref:hypothetical protein n=1 Tax=Nocardia sputi TaxID=2943705 RepID=UPI0020BDD925|nr:hypothetical protein [Nocardia sputi]